MVASSPMGRRKRWVIGGVICVCVVIGALVGRIYTRPYASDDEIASIARETTRAILERRAERCFRPPLRGDAIAGSGRDEVIAILAQNDCRTRTMAPGWASAPDGELPPDPLVPLDPFDGAPAPNAIPLEMAPRLPPMLQRTAQPAERAVIDECGRAVARMRRAIAHEDLCSPFGIETYGNDGLDNSFERVEHAFATIARDEVRQGRLLEGIEVLLDAMRLAMDMARGPATRNVAMDGSVRLGVLENEFEVLLAQDMGWDDATLRQLEAEVIVLAQTSPMPDRPHREDPWATLAATLPLLAWEPPERLRTRLSDDFIQHTWRDSGGDIELSLDDGRRAAVTSAHRMLGWVSQLRCSPADTREACDRRLRATVAASARRPAPMVWWRTWLRSARGRIETIVDENPLEYHVQAGFGSRAWREAVARALWIVLEHRRLTVTGTACPTARELTARIGPIPTERGLGGHFTFRNVSLPFHPIAVFPPWWIEGNAPVLVYCPMLPGLRSAAP